MTRSSTLRPALAALLAATLSGALAGCAADRPRTVVQPAPPPPPTGCDRDDAPLSCAGMTDADVSRVPDAR